MLFRLPSPFDRSNRKSIVIKPTIGNFLTDYSCDKPLLHIGFTDSRGRVYHFNESGLNQDELWDHCVSINLEELRTDYDNLIEDYLNRNRLIWTKENYLPTNRNCFDFVLNFIKFIKYSKFDNEYLMDKTSFCTNIIIDHTKKAFKYIANYKKLLKEQFVIIKD